MELKSPDGTALASIRENILEADPVHLHDLKLDTAPTHVKVWLSQSDVGLELSFRRITLAQLDAILREDRERSERKLEESRRTLTGSFPLEIRQMMRMATDGPSPVEMMRKMLSNSNLPIGIREALLSGDPTGRMVREYAKRELDDEGKVALLNVRKLHIHSNGRELVVGDGLGSFISSHRHQVLHGIYGLSRSFDTPQQIGKWKKGEMQEALERDRLES